MAATYTGLRAKSIEIGSPDATEKALMKGLGSKQLQSI